MATALPLLHLGADLAVEFVEKVSLLLRFVSFLNLCTVACHAARSRSGAAVHSCGAARGVGPRCSSGPAHTSMAPGWSRRLGRGAASPRVVVGFCISACLESVSHTALELLLLLGTPRSGAKTVALGDAARAIAFRAAPYSASGRARVRTARTSI